MQESASLQKGAFHLKTENQRLLRELNLDAEAAQQLAKRAAVLVCLPRCDDASLAFF